MKIIIITLGILVTIASLCLFVGLAAYAITRRAKHLEYHDNTPESRRMVKEQYPIQKWPLGLSLITLVVILLVSSFVIIPSGYTGVRTTFGLIDQESCMPGFNTVIPFVQKISLVNNKQQDIRFTGKVWSETSEQTVVYMENISVTYQIVPESSAWIYANVENWIEELVDGDIVSSALKAAARKQTADIVTDRAVIEPASKEQLQEAVDTKYGPGRVLIKDVIINNMDFEDSYNDAIAKKSAAMQEQQEQAIRNKTNIDKATAEAEAKRISAQGEADAEKIKAEGKAEANRIVSESITDATQRQDMIDKWNGQLPRYMGGDAGISILDGSVTTTD